MLRYINLSFFFQIPAICPVAPAFFRYVCAGFPLKSITFSIVLFNTGYAENVPCPALSL